MSAPPPPPTSVQLLLLGDPQVRVCRDGVWQPVALQAKRLAVLSVLALQGGPVRRDLLLAMFWPESTDAAARSALSKALHYLRTVLHPGVLVTSGEDQVALDLQRVTVDVGQLATQLGDERRGPGALSPELFALYRGPLLAGLHVDGAPDFGGWLDGERARWEARVQGAVTATVQSLRTRGACHEAVALAAAALPRFPLAEVLVREAMQALDDSGDRAGAVRLYDRFAAELQRTLDLPPSPETVRLAEQLRARRAAGGVAVAPVDVPVQVPVDVVADVPVHAPVNVPVNVPVNATSLTVAADAVAEHAVPEHAVPVQATATLVGAAAVSAYPASVAPWRSARGWLLVALLAAVGSALFAWRRDAGMSPGRAGIAAHGLSATVGAAALDSARVLVLPFADNTGDSTLRPVATMAADFITQALAQMPGVRVVPTTAALALTPRGTARVTAALNAATAAANATANAAVNAPVNAANVARESGAGVVLSGAVYAQGDSLVLTATAIEAASGTVLGTVTPVRARRDAVLPALDTLRARVLTVLAPRLDTRVASYAGAMSVPPSFDAYRAYVTGLERFVATDFPGARQSFTRATALGGAWPLPWVYLGLAASNLGDDATIRRVIAELTPRAAELAPYDRAGFDAVRAWHVGDRQGAYDAALRARALAPGGIAAAQVGKEALSLGRPREAVAALMALDPSRGELRGYPLYWENLLEAQHLRGDQAGERRALAEATRQYPNAGWLALAEVRAAVARHDARVLDALFDSTGSAWARATARGDDVTLLRVATLEALAHGDTVRARAWGARGIASARARLARATTAADSVALREALVELSVATDSVAAAAQHMDAIPAHVQTLAVLGWRAAVRVLQGEELSDRALSEWLQQAQPAPRYGADALWRARIAAVRGDRTTTVMALQQAFARGWSYSSRVHADLLMGALRHDGAVRRLLAPDS